MVGESNQNVFLIQIDASNFEEFDISEFEILRVDCITMWLHIIWRWGLFYKSKLPEVQINLLFG